MTDQEPKPEGADPSVPLETASQHALLAARGAAASGVPDFDGWERATIDPEPLVIDDLNGQRLFYDFDVVLDDRAVGVVRASANRLVGSPIVSIQLGPHRWSPDQAQRQARRSAEEEGQRVRGTSLVCYSYPKIGVRVDAADREGGVSAQLFDVADLEPVDRFGSDELEGRAAYSFLAEAAIGEAGRRTERWSAADRELAVVRERMPNALDRLGRDFDLVEFRRLQLERIPYRIFELYSWDTVRYAPRCQRPEVFQLYAQKTPVYCAVATGQMILDFYKYHFDQDAIAVAMSTGPYGTSNGGQVAGYESLSNNGLSATYDPTASWVEAKAEIEANRPLKSGIPGHARACDGWQRKNLLLIGQPPQRWLRICDPWPWNADICDGGAIYWEDWDAVLHTNFIYVRHA